MDEIEILNVSPHAPPHSATDELLTSSPIRLLPREILVEIFALAISWVLCNPPRTINDPLLRISAVCRRWYYTAINTKTLWAHIDVNLYPDKGSHDSLHIADSTRLWLQRSAGSPIHLHFSGFIGVSDLLIQEYLETLEPYAATVSSLIFSQYSPESVVREVLNLCSSHSMPGILQNFAVGKVLSEAGTNKQFLWPTSYLCGLTTLQLGRCPNLTVPDFVTILASSPCLRRLQLCDLVPIPALGAQETPVVLLPSLQLLELKYVRTYALSRILGNLSVGGHDLHVKLDLPVYDSEVRAVLPAFLERSVIRSLSLRNEAIFIVKDSLHSLKLHTLDFDFGELDNEHWLSLLVDSTTEGELIPKCPSIRHLGITGGLLQGPTQALLKKITEAYSLTCISFTETAWDGATVSLEDDFSRWLLQRVGNLTIIPLSSLDNEANIFRRRRGPSIVFGSL